MQTNKCDLGAPSCILEVMIGELARDPNNHEIPFRKTINKESKDSNVDMERNFYSTNLVNLATINSTFTGLTSEDINAVLISSIGKSRTGGKETETPMEKVMKY